MAAKTTTTKTTVKPDLTPTEAASPTVALTDAERLRAQTEEAGERLNSLVTTVTQREWLLITRALDRTRAEIGADQGLTLTAMAWVKECRDHGGASWDRLLEMTDRQLLELHGFPTAS